MQTIRIGILGAARIAPKAAVLPARGNPEFQIAAVAARDKARAGAFAAENGIPAVADSYAALVARDDIDLVYVALPTNTHMKWSIAALKAGKAVLCEKPFAMNTGQALIMAANAAAAGRPLIEAFHNRFHTVMWRAIEIVRSGEMGRLVDAEAVFDAPIPYKPTELRWSPVLGGGGALMDLGCYCVHALRTITGEEPKVVRAQCAIEHGVDAETAAELAFSGGLMARMRTSMKKPFSATLTMKGEKGSLSISNFLAPQMGCTFTVESGGKTREEPTAGPATYDAQLAHVGDVLLRGAKPLTGGDDAIANMACIDAIYQAGGYGRASER
jgi:predicted dehydrogenase